MASEAIPARKGYQRKFQFHQIIKWDGNLFGSMSHFADGDGKIFRFMEHLSQDHLWVEFYDETKSSRTKVERKGEWPNRLHGFSATLDSMNPHQIFFFGGSDYKEWKNTNDLWLFHTQTLSFKKMKVNSEKPKGRSNHQAVMMGKKIVILGGLG